LSIKLSSFIRYAVSILDKTLKLTGEELLESHSLNHLLGNFYFQKLSLIKEIEEEVSTFQEIVSIFELSDPDIFLYTSISRLSTLIESLMLHGEFDEIISLLVNQLVDPYKKVI
jgi:hypothetical protein